jgi:hypothetical protein
MPEEIDELHRDPEVQAELSSISGYWGIMGNESLTLDTFGIPGNGYACLLCEV